MNKGMTDTVTARMRNERQSDHSTHASRIGGAVAATTAVGRWRAK